MSQTNAVLLGLWEDAAAALSRSKSYTINGRTLTRANLDETLKAIAFFKNAVAQESSNTGGTGLISFGDAQ